MKRILMLICACFLTLSFAKEQTAKVSLEIQKDIQQKQLIEQFRYEQNSEQREKLEMIDNFSNVKESEDELIKEIYSQDSQLRDKLLWLSSLPHSRENTRECEVGETEVQLIVDGGSWQAEISWTLFDAEGNEVLIGGAPYDGIICLTDGDYEFTGCDSYGDGWNGNVANFYEVGGSLFATSAGPDSALGAGECATVTISVGAEVNAGCTDVIACNYDSTATLNDGTCWYPQEGCTCDSGDSDGDGLCDDIDNCDGGVVDECGVCEGDGTACSACAWPNWYDDNYCDSSNNNAECGYDGGDCCPGDCPVGGYNNPGSYSCEVQGGDCTDCLDPDSADWQDGGYCADYEHTCDNATEWDYCSSQVVTGWYSCETITSWGYDCTFAEECGLCPASCDDPEAINFGDLGDCVYTCAELGDYVDDCVDSDCCFSSWIGDGLCDGEDQQWGCDLTCYDNDGGDCAPVVTCEEQGLFTCPDGTCAADVDSCPDAGCSDVGGVENWISDGYCDSSNNNVTCAWDGGDCCASSCVPATYDCDDSGASWGPCYTDNCLDPEGNNDSCGGDPLCEDIDACNFGDVGDCTYAEDGYDCDGNYLCTPGDVNADDALNVLDIVAIVGYILNGGDDFPVACADINTDGAVNVLDIVAIVGEILNGRARDATKATLIKNGNSLKINADGFIGGIQMTLSHGADFSIQLTDKAMVAEFATNGNKTTLVVVAPETDHLFTSNGEYAITEMIVASASSEINVKMVTAFSIIEAYPNPFNPSTTLSVNMPESGFLSVKVYNLMGQVVTTLADRNVEANTYSFTWNASDMPSGLYMVRAEALGNISMQKLMLLK